MTDPATGSVRPDGSVQHGAAVALLREWRAPTPEQGRLRLRYLRHLDQNPRGLDRDCLPEHLTASTLVFSAGGRRVLLTLHAKAKRWFQLGGHCDASDTTLAGAALREAMEESGLPANALTLDPRPVQLSPHDVSFCGPGGGARHLDVRFLAVAAERALPRAGEESVALAWWPVEALPDPASDLRELVRLSLRRLSARRHTRQPACAD